MYELGQVDGTEISKFGLIPQFDDFRITVYSSPYLRLRKHFI